MLPEAAPLTDPEPKHPHNTGTRATSIPLPLQERPNRMAFVYKLIRVAQFYILMMNMQAEVTIPLINQMDFNPLYLCFAGLPYVLASNFFSEYTVKSLNPLPQRIIDNIFVQGFGLWIYHKLRAERNEMDVVTMIQQIGPQILAVILFFITGLMSVIRESTESFINNHPSYYSKGDSNDNSGGDGNGNSDKSDSEAEELTSPQSEDTNLGFVSDNCEK